MEEKKVARKLPVGIQDFEKLRTEGFLYVDKTRYIYNLVTASKAFFLSRPRRFGKSLFISALKAFFEGKKELFKGLEIENLISSDSALGSWQSYTVFHVDFSTETFAIRGNLEKRLETFLSDHEKIYGSDPVRTTFASRFEYLIQTACKKSGQRVVVLIDEYDKPILDAVSDTVLQDDNRETLRGFYSVLKGNDAYLRFVWLSGISKFSKLSIFSDLNHLDDISLTERYAGICGITEEELESNFVPEINALAKKQELTREKCLAKLKKMYDGYHFYQNVKGVYNPFSLLNALDKLDFRSYWFATGTPTILIKKLEDSSLDLQSLDNGSIMIDERALSDYRIDNPDPVPLFYQSGYLTIAGYQKKYSQYILRFPNDEVKYAFIDSIKPYYLNELKSDSPLNVANFCRDLDDENLDSLMKRFKALFANLPYDATEKDSLVERNFQNVIYIVFLLMGQYVKVEQHTSHGRADCIVENDNAVFIFEFKRDSTASVALQQINEMKYADAYSADSRKIVKIGVSFSSKEKNITDWKFE